MSMMYHFSDALDTVGQAIINQGLAGIDSVLLLRDLQGRMRLLVNQPDPNGMEQELGSIQATLEGLSPYCGGKTLFQNDLYDMQSIFSDPAITEMRLPSWSTPIRVLDKQVMGQDWLRPQNSETASHIPRIVFFGVKGGVGRSTALSMLAWQQARQGKKVLLLDLDLESPGLSGLLLPQEMQSDYGIMDWLIEDAVGQGQGIMHSLVVTSPLSARTIGGSIRVVSACGRSDSGYLDKLNRVYQDIVVNNVRQSFSRRIARLIAELEVQESPDIVLIDSRSGLHDIAALSIVGLSSIALLFGTDSPQSWGGYRQLFCHWQRHPLILAQIRERLKMVHALFPQSDQERRVNQFISVSHELFTDTLYESSEPGSVDDDYFNYSIHDDVAPHQPLRINWDPRFQEFDPQALFEGVFTEDQVRATFGLFLDGVQNLIDASREEAVS